MVRLNTKLARLMLLAILPMIAAWPANAQWAPPPALQQQPAPPRQEQPSPSQEQAPLPQEQTPPSATGPMHWRAQGNTVQPVPQPGQQIQGVPSPQPTTQPPVQQAAPAYTQGAAGPASAVAKPALTPTSHRRSGRTSKTQVTEIPQTPPLAPTLDQLPPTPPQVRYQNGQLTINAQNSTLSQILRAVQAQTGASIDIPGLANSERVAMQIGPGQPRDVLNTLLNGSKFNYVILGVTGDPGAVQKVILTLRQGGPTGVATAQNNPGSQSLEAEDEGAVAENPEPEYQGPGGQQQGPPVPGAFRHPGIPVQPPNQQQNVYAPDDQQQNNGTKSPEQLMQELQQMQQQQQQLQDQLNPANRQPQ